MKTFTTELALNFILNFPLFDDNGNSLGMPLPSDTRLTGSGSRLLKAEFGKNARQDLKNILKMPTQTERERAYRKQVLTQYLTQIITDAELREDINVPSDYLDRTITFWLKNLRGSVFRSNLLAFINRKWVTDAAFLNQFSIRNRQYLKGLARNLERQQQREVSLVVDDEGGQTERDLPFDEMPIDEQIQRREEQLRLKIKMTRLTDDEKYFMDIMFIQKGIPRMKRYELLGITRNTQVKSITDKILRKIRRPLSDIEQKLFRLYQNKYKYDDS